MIRECRFETREKLLDALFETVQGSLQQDLAKNPSVTLMLSGGSTPGPLYERLSQAELEWSRVHVALVDERWVEASHEASNQQLIQRTLLQNKASNASFLAMKNKAETPFAGEVECQAQCATLPAPYSVCLLGMGPDGHTASLFPNARGLEQALESSELCAAIEANPSEVTGAWVERMTLTPKAILGAKKLVLLITGEDKWQVYEAAKVAVDVKAIPVAAILQQPYIELDVFWAP